MATMVTKIILLLLAVCAFSTQGSQAAVIKSLESQRATTNIVKLGKSDYRAVSIQKNVLSVAKTVKSADDTKNCKIIIDPFEDAIIDQVRTMTFEQLIVVWGVRHVQEVDEFKFVRYTLLLVDPQGCSYKPLTLPTDEVPINYPTLSPEVTIVPNPSYGKALNVFFPTLKKCAPCQYYPKDGSIKKLDHQIQPPIMRPSKSLHIQPFNEMNNQYHNGYLFAYNYGIGTAKLEYLDKNFTTVIRRYLNHTVDTISIVTSAADRQNIAACWRHDNNQIRCERFDSRLNSKAFYNLDGDKVSIQFDKYQNAYVNLANKSRGIHLQIYDVFGQLIDEHDVGSTMRKSVNVQHSAVHGFLEDFDNPRDYCLIMSENLTDIEADYSMKCIDVSQYTKLP